MGKNTSIMLVFESHIGYYNFVHCLGRPQKTADLLNTLYFRHKDTFCCLDNLILFIETRS